MRWPAVFVCFALPAAAIVGGHFLGLWVALGAHPWWSLNGALIGIAAGMAVAAIVLPIIRLARLSAPLTSFGFLVLALVASYFALSGKEAFAASYARDVLSGRFWYVGYISAISALYVALVMACAAAFAHRS